MDPILIISVGGAGAIALIGLSIKIATLTQKKALIQSLLDEKTIRLTEAEQETHRNRMEIQTLQQNNTYLKTTLEHAKAQHAEQIAVWTQATTTLQNTFAALSSKALEQNNSSFLKLAETSLSKFQEGAKKDLDGRHKAIHELLTPVKEALSGVDKKIHAMEKERVGAYETLKVQVGDLIKTQKELRSETSQLVQALRTPNVRGRWGEIQLKRVVEIAGMLAYCDFFEQSSLDHNDEKFRPDMVIRLPGGKNIVVDAKTPLTSYLESLETQDPDIRLIKLKQHAKLVRSHITKLSSKSYWDKLELSPEFVILFLPGESFFSAALEQDPSLIELGAEQRVILATPTTLISLLRAVSYGWRQEILSHNAQKICDLGQELYKRLADLAGHFTKIGKSLGIATASYNQTLGTFERRVLVTARKFKELGATPPSQDIESLNEVELNPRELIKEE